MYNLIAPVETSIEYTIKSHNFWKNDNSDPLTDCQMAIKKYIEVNVFIPKIMRLSWLNRERIGNYCLELFKGSTTETNPDKLVESLLGCKIVWDNSVSDSVVKFQSPQLDSTYNYVINVGSTIILKVD